MTINFELFLKAIFIYWLLLCTIMTTVIAIDSFTMQTSQPMVIQGSIEPFVIVMHKGALLPKTIERIK